MTLNKKGLLESSLPIRSFSFAFILFSTCISSPLAYGEDSLNLSANQSFAYDSNPLVTSSDADSIYGSETRASINYNKTIQNKSLLGNAAVLRNQFNDSDFNSTDFYFDGGYITSTPRAQLSLDGDVVYNTTRTGEETTLGLNREIGRRLFWNFNPSYNYKLSQRLTGGLQTKWEETHYESDSLTDFRTISIIPSTVYNLTQQQRLIQSLRMQRYEPLNGTNQSVNSYGPYFGWEYQFHPQYSITLYGGILGTQYKGYTLIEDDWQFNPIYSASLARESERHRTSLSISRSRQSYATGIESDLTTIEGQNLFTISDSLTLNLRALYQHVEDTNVPASNLDSAIEESLNLNYKLAEKWDLTLSQKYRSEDYINSPDNADRNIIRLGLTYNFNANR